MLSWIFLRDMCPSTTAGMPAKIHKQVTDRIPSTRLAVALPSVGGSMPGRSTWLGMACIAGTLSQGDAGWPEEGEGAGG